MTEGTTLTSIPSRIRNWMFGPPGLPPLQGQHYPDQSDVENARVNDASYGSDVAAFVQPPYGGQIASPHTKQQLMDTFDRMDETGQMPLKPAAVSSKMSDDLMAGYLASNRSALAGLGFDPRHMAVGEAPAAQWTINGAYYPKEDEILSTGSYPSTLVHESMHRGIQKLREAGMLPKELGGMSEESIVRGQMQRNYGDVEKGRGQVGDEQMANGRFYNENRNFSPQMDALEIAAQQLYAQRHPRGPR